ESARLAFVVGDAHAGVDGFAQTGVATAPTFYAEERPRTEAMFEDNEPAPYRTRGSRQDRRGRSCPVRRDAERPRFIPPRADERPDARRHRGMELAWAPDIRHDPDTYDNVAKTTRSTGSMAS